MLRELSATMLVDIAVKTKLSFAAQNREIPQPQLNPEKKTK